MSRTVDCKLDLSRALASARMAAWSYDVDAGDLTWSPEFQDLLCWKGEGEPAFGDILACLLPGERERIAECILSTMAHGDPFFRVDVRMRRFDNEVRWFLLRAQINKTDDGGLREITGVLADLTDRKQEELENAYLAAVVASTPYAVISVDTNRRIASWNEGAVQTFGYAKEEAIGLPIRVIVPDDIWPDEYARMSSTLAGAPIAFESLRQRKDGSSFPAKITASPIIAPDKSVIGVSAIIEDRTETKASEERQRLLVRELHHRVRNTLATVQGIASVTARVSEDLEDFRNAFSRRIAALAQTHARLTDAGKQAVSVADLIEQELGPFASGDRVSVEGPEVGLSSQVAPTLAMAIHELATNAIKHGSLSTSRGTIAIHWSVDVGTLNFSWAEHGPSKDWTSTRKGFGTTLLDTVIPAQFGQEVRRQFVEDGIRVRLSVPLGEA